VLIASLSIHWRSEKIADLESRMAENLVITTPQRAGSATVPTGLLDCRSEVENFKRAPVYGALFPKPRLGGRNEGELDGDYQARR
jgi:hypothetical protein